MKNSGNGGKIDMRRNIKKILICIYFILLGCVFINTAFSRHSKQISNTISVDVAKIKLNVINETSSLENISNEQQEIRFTVNNYDGTKENPIYNETTYQYQISIITTNSIPLQYELYKLENGVETQITLTDGKSNMLTMPKSQIQEDKFVLKVKMVDKDYKNETGDINISVNAIQL